MDTAYVDSMDTPYWQSSNVFVLASNYAPFSLTITTPVSPSPNYVSGPKYPPSPDFVPEPVYPEFMPPEDEVLPAKEQPLPAALSPTADSPGYDPADYPADGGDDGDDEDESSDDDEDDDDDIKGDEEEEEHPAPTDSTVVALPVVDQAPSAEETESILIRDEPPTPFWSDTEIPSPPLPLILSPLPISPPPLSSPTYPLGYRAAMIWLRSEAPSTSHSPPPHIILSHTRADTPPSGTLPSRTPPLSPILLPTSSTPLHLLSTHRRADRPEVTLPPWKRLGIILGPRYEVGESSSAPTARPPGGFRVDYGFVATMDREIMRDLERDGRSMDASDLARSEVMTLRTQVVAHQAVIAELQAADRRGQAAITEMLAADHRRQAQFIEALKLLKRLQT
ncbi:hypothetical protein Tco_0990021 [Tanacetum coccineum]|uniref:Uncharacterized protein n=1 Tax=Tanacetum coccineum TaxID=301880 RepID=A0ABQ5EWQ7_9ASTR